MAAVGGGGGLSVNMTKTCPPLPPPPLPPLPPLPTAGSIPTWANHWVNELMGYWVIGFMGRGSYFSGGRVFRNIPYVSKHASPSPSASVVLLASYNIQRNNTIQYKVIPILLYAMPSLT